jgi:FkbM family methyltransferase
MHIASALRRVRKLIRLAGAGEYLRGLRYGVAAAIEHTKVIRELRPGMIIDVGANMGQFSLLARREASCARIVAFEPLPEPAERYRRLFFGDDNVTLHICAIGRASGPAEMHVSRRADSSSLLPISPAQVELFPGTEEVTTRVVNIAPLTQFLSLEDLAEGTLLKIDVQGFELDVLKSAEPLLPMIAWVYVEASYVPFYEGQALADEVIAYLQGRGFNLKGHCNPTHLRGQIAQADFLFENKNRVS